jgi:hypothetical protein
VIENVTYGGGVRGKGTRGKLALNATSKGIRVLVRQSDLQAASMSAFSFYQR